MPRKTHTHYDNLKVPHDADTKTIRAAYRTLCQQYHPDRCPNNPDAHRIMSIINRSYTVLSTPEKRRKHDEWIAKQNPNQSGGANEKISSPMPPNLHKQETPIARTQYWLWLLAVGLAICALFLYTQQQRAEATRQGKDLPVKTRT